MAGDVAIVACGGANIASLQYALQRIGREAVITDEPAVIHSASHVILPGVGAAAAGMSRLKQRGLDRTLRTLQQPVLGICLGMPLLLEFSEEGATSCLGVIPGSVRKMTAASDRPVPHMGWNTLDLVQPHPLFHGIKQGEYAYFVHSYALPHGTPTLVSCCYGEAFSAAIAQGNFTGVQFHPERSAKMGERVLSNFLDL